MSTDPKIQGVRALPDGSFDLCDEDECCPNIKLVEPSGGAGPVYMIRDDDGNTVTLTARQIRLAALVAQ